MSQSNTLATIPKGVPSVASKGCDFLKLFSKNKMKEMSETFVLSGWLM